jgi:hypothetical protein
MSRVRLKGEKVIDKSDFHFDVRDIKTSSALKMHQTTSELLEYAIDEHEGEMKEVINQVVELERY